MNILIEKGINDANALSLCEWSNDKGRDFQEQWMGNKVSYPLDCDKIRKLENVFSIFNDDEFVGIIQEIRSSIDSIHIGRFVINPEKTGMGLGSMALKEFLKYIFDNKNVNSITLSVFDSNKVAKNLYEKQGFIIEKTIEKPKLKYIMRRFR